MRSAPAKFEVRAGPLELRALGNCTVTGYAAVFHQTARIANDFYERIERGAFSSTLASGRDVLALADHDQTKLLGRTRSGTLQLREDNHGLRFDLSLPDTQLGHDILALVQRGDMGGASFGFAVTDEKWNGKLREVRSVQLYEISLVSSWPAYEGTSVAARSKGMSVALARRYLETFR